MKKIAFFLLLSLVVPVSLFSENEGRNVDAYGTDIALYASHKGNSSHDWIVSHVPYVNGVDLHTKGKYWVKYGGFDEKVYFMIDM